MINNFSKGFLALLLCLFTGLIIWKKSGSFSYLSSPRDKSIQVECPLETLSCSFETEHGPIGISVNATIKPLAPFIITLTHEDNFLKNARIHFEGLEDYMGLNNFSFTPTADKTHWQARGSIPVCTTASKTWRVTINLQTPSKISSYWFKLQVL